MTSIPPEADRVLISVNPTAGAGSADLRVQRLVALLSQRGLHAEVLSDLADISVRANRWQAAGKLRALVGVGGDGTAAELVNRTEPRVPITILPTGTANLLATHLGIGNSPEDVCRTIAAGKLLRLDAGRAGERVFLLMFSCGIDADIVERLHTIRTGHISRLSYVGPMLRSFQCYRFPEIQVYCEDWDGPGEQQCPPRFSAGWVFAFNLPCYGGGFRAAPDADATDGLLDVCAFGPRSFWHGLRFVAAAAWGVHHRMRDCTTGRVRRLRVTSEEPVPYQLDGDPGGYLPLDIEVLPERLTLVVPPGEGDG